jgi:hypothetical protein
MAQFSTAQTRSSPNFKSSFIDAENSKPPSMRVGLPRLKSFLAVKILTSKNSFSFKIGFRIGHPKISVLRKMPRLASCNECQHQYPNRVNHERSHSKSPLYSRGNLHPRHPNPHSHQHQHRRSNTDKERFQCPGS